LVASFDAHDSLVVVLLLLLLLLLFFFKLLILRSVIQGPLLRSIVYFISSHQL